MFERSKKFFALFNAIYSESNPKRQDAVAKYTNSTAFTSFITNELNRIISSLGYTPQNEYFRIDAMGYTSRQDKLDSLPGFYSYLWDLEIAIEHENEAAKWLDEVVKLAHICCPLRVVIGYVPMNLRPTEDTLRLAYAAKTLQSLACADNALCGEFMVILGNSNTHGNVQNYFNYKAYVLDKDTYSFKELQM